MLSRQHETIVILFMATTTKLYMIVRLKDGIPDTLIIQDDYDTAYEIWDEMQANWSDCFLCEIIKGKESLITSKEV